MNFNRIDMTDTRVYSICYISGYLEGLSPIFLSDTPKKRRNGLRPTRTKKKVEEGEEEAATLFFFSSLPVCSVSFVHYIVVNDSQANKKESIAEIIRIHLLFSFFFFYYSPFLFQFYLFSFFFFFFFFF